jgi:hypothetical protein
MSPMRKPSAVDSIRRAADRTGAEKRAAEVQSAKPARITLNLPPALYRQLSRWADATAEQLDVPRVPVQDALRAMIQALTVDDVCGGVVTDLLRRELAD